MVRGEIVSADFGLGRVSRNSRLERKRSRTIVRRWSRVDPRPVLTLAEISARRHCMQRNVTCFLVCSQVRDLSVLASELGPWRLNVAAAELDLLFRPISGLNRS